MGSGTVQFPLLAFESEHDRTELQQGIARGAEAIDTET